MVTCLCIIWWITIWWIFLCMHWELSWYYTHTLTNQVWSPLMCSLVDQVPEPKETQLTSVLPYSAGPAGLSVQELAVEVSCILEHTLKCKQPHWEVWTDWSVHAENVAQKSWQNTLLYHTLATWGIPCCHLELVYSQHPAIAQSKGYSDPNA